MPRVSLQLSFRYSKLSLRSTRVRMSFSSLGYSAIAFLITSSYSSKISSVWWLEGNSYSYSAPMRAFCMVFSPADILRLPSIHLMINLASSLEDSSSRFIRRFYFSDCELLPLVLPILMKVANTFSIVRGTFARFLVKKESIVF